MSIWRFSDGIANVPAEYRITLGEGGTPLLRSRSIGPKLGLANLLFKVESSNPSGSYKDRFAAAAVSHMLAQRQDVCLATSSGNTGSALAAYCAAAGIVCRIVIVETTPDGKLKQMLAYGAKLARVKGFGLDSAVTANTMECLKQQAVSTGGSLQISAFHYSPAGMSGVQTIAYELAEQLPQGIIHVFCPAGGGGLTFAVARGFARLLERNQIARSPAIHCVQPSGNNTIAGPLRCGADRAQAVSCTSKVSGLQVPNVIDGDDVIAICRSTGGSGHLIEDDEAWAAQYQLSHEEGIFCEPAAAVSLAGVLRAAAGEEIQTDAAVVCLVTGSAFKDPNSLDRLADNNVCETIDLSDLRTWLER
jgi:threonine synthase